MRISDWSSDVCSSDLGTAPSSPAAPLDAATAPCQDAAALPLRVPPMIETALVALTTFFATIGPLDVAALFAALTPHNTSRERRAIAMKGTLIATGILLFFVVFGDRSEEHTSELQSLMRISYAVFCLKKKKTKNHNK